MTIRRTSAASVARCAIGSLLHRAVGTAVIPIIPNTFTVHAVRCGTRSARGEYVRAVTTGGVGHRA